MFIGMIRNQKIRFATVSFEKVHSYQLVQFQLFDGIQQYQEVVGPYSIQLQLEATNL